MLKTILKTLALSATTLTLLSACGASEILRCSEFGLGEKAFDRPSCDWFTGGADVSLYKNAPIGGPIVDETGTATYDGTFGLQGSDTRTGGVRLTVNFDEKKITNDNSIHSTSVNINGEFTERGVLTGKFNMENDGIASADINGMVGYDGIWATFDNRSETADGYVGGFIATRLSEDYPAVLADGQQAGSNGLTSQFTRGGFLGVGSNKPLTKEEIAAYFTKEDAAKYIDEELTGLIGDFGDVDEYEEKELTDDSNKYIDLDLTSDPVTPEICSDCTTLTSTEIAEIEERIAEEERLARQARIEEIKASLGGEDYHLSVEEYRAALIPVHGDGSGFYSTTNQLTDLYRLGGEGYRVASVAHLLELSRVIEDDDRSYKKLSRLEKLRSEEYNLDHELRIQAEFKEDPSAFNTTSAHVSAIRVAGTYYDNGTRYHGDDTIDITHSKPHNTFGIRKDKGEETALIMTLNGVEYDLVPNIIVHQEAAHLGATIVYKSYFHNEENNSIYFVGNPNILKIIGGTHATIQGDYVKYARYVNEVIGTDNYYESESQRRLDDTRGFATIGIHTPASVVDLQSATATYKGTGELDFNSNVLPVYFGSIWTASLTEITMNVDFDANTIAGTGDDTDSSDKIIFNSAPIVGNGFSGTFTMSKELYDFFSLSGNSTGQYSGGFFGPNADDLAGVMSFEGTDSGGAVIGRGGFRADRQ